MAIKIVSEKHLHLTRRERLYYRRMYDAFMPFYSGPPLSFEAYVKHCRRSGL